jgi:hypothetical protein
MAATAVYVAGDIDIDRDGDEIFVYNVYVGDDDAEPVGKTYTVYRGRAAAIALAERICRDRRLAEVVVE